MGFHLRVCIPPSIHPSIHPSISTDLPLILCPLLKPQRRGLHRPSPQERSGGGERVSRWRRHNYRVVAVWQGGAGGRSRDDPSPFLWSSVCHMDELRQPSQWVPRLSKGKTCWRGGVPTCGLTPPPGFCLGHGAWNQILRVQRAPNSYFSLWRGIIAGPSPLPWKPTTM